jgi:hypothetical protein
MTTRRSLALVLSTLVFGTLSAGTAEAQWGGYFPYNAGSMYTQERMPYFSQFPPVYYKFPVPRTYGYSPFAYPPGYVTPDRGASRPEIVVNRYVVREPSEAGDSLPAYGPQPEVIINPFVPQ